MNDDFDAFVRRQQALVPPLPVDPRARLDEWISALQALDDAARAWLGPWLEAGRVEARTDLTTLEEPALGRYDAPLLRLRIGGLEVRVEPRGADAVGARGRADLVGVLGVQPLVLAGLPPVWKLAAVSEGQGFEELTRERFLSAVIQVTEGAPDLALRPKRVPDRVAVSVRNR